MKFTGVPHLMWISLVRISLLRFFKTFHKYLPYANFGLFISLVRFFSGLSYKSLRTIIIFHRTNNYLLPNGSGDISLAYPHCPLMFHRACVVIYILLSLDKEKLIEKLTNELEIPHLWLLRLRMAKMQQQHWSIIYPVLRWRCM